MVIATTGINSLKVMSFMPQALTAFHDHQHPASFLFRKSLGGVNVFLLYSLEIVYR